MRRTIAVVLVIVSLQSLPVLSVIVNSRLNYFDIDLLRYVAEGKSGNVMISPASIKSTLAMLLEGARGETAREIQSALRLAPNKEDYREQLSYFFKDLEVNASGVTVENANGLFVSKNLKLKKDYEMMTENIYLSEINKMDFSDPKTAANGINAWISRKTKGLIPDIIDQAHIDPLTELLVTNALYFKGTWLNQFEANLTHGDCFYKETVCKTVAMMDLQAELNYAYVENLRAHALELPYEDKRYSMILLVPQDRDTGLAIIRDLPYIGLLQISTLMEPTDVILTMPKFTVEYSEDLVAALKNMRINALFSNSANLSGIFEGSSAHINGMYHKAYMSVDEKGTVAAAASAGFIIPLINDQVQLRVDRPFLFFIWDNDKGIVLFEGKVEEPTEFIAVKTTTKTADDFKSQPIPIPISILDEIYSNKPISSQPSPPSSSPIQPGVSQPVDRNDRVQMTKFLSPYETTQEYPTTRSPSRKSNRGSWYKSICEYFG